MEIIRKTTMDAWKAALTHIMERGEDFNDHDSRVCREILNLTLAIESPERDFEKPIDYMQNFKFVYPTKEELASIILSKDASAVYEFSYGPRIFNFMGQKDQINDFIIPVLKKYPLSRRAVICLFNPLTDMDVFSKNIPSLMFVHFKIKDKKLDATFFIRSNDFFIGWPGNIYQLHTLQKYVANQLNMPAGSLTTISSSAHIFHEHFEMIKEVIRK